MRKKNTTAATETFRAARLLAAHTRPYFATAILATVPVERPGLGTMAVDEAWRLYWDPETVELWGAKAASVVILHEINHLIREHAARARALQADSIVWNVAADLEINDNLVAEHLTFPASHPPLLPKAFGFEDKALAEDYYYRLVDRSTRAPALPSEASGARTARAPGPEGRIDPRRQPRGAAARPALLIEPARAAVSASCVWSCGSGAHAWRELWDEPGSTAEPRVNAVEATLIRRDVARRVIEHARSSPGSVSSGLLRWAGTFIMPPKVRWQTLLAAAVRASVSDVTGQVDYSYRRPSRRSAAYGAVIMPAMRRPVPDVALVADTSGSMNETALTRVVAETRGVLRHVGVDGIRFLATDAKVHTCQRVRDARRVELRGGGGTRMAAGIEAALALRPRPNVCVVITDGLTPWPEAHPGAGVRYVVVLVGSSGSAPPWSRALRVDE